ncbi:ribose-5-phosphate isomerase RpiA [Magnetospira sp. QH-2]|uniref:ribose-5-phosphate isomerase RpiA n=1 Tax=Magnetospira sp. (strain QH-2) TaxID=1288970 RepID=UPI0003E81080|nr:ribose-5-phosphate isomerase RpiA [Magnetospira sp. QH-2]CCQ73561.1 Ribose-5-phosphate isomerase A 1 [Magnetospira sp. QH-2]
MSDQQNNEKKLAGQAAADLVQDGMLVGLGTGSTVNFFLHSLGNRVKKGLKIKGLPTSERTAALCHELGIELTDFASVDKLDMAIDGADEIDGDFQMIKGGGGALLREKIVASAADHVVIMVDGSKRVETLGQFPLPVEIVKFGHQQAERRVQELGIPYAMRLVDGEPYVTDNGNYILDCQMDSIIAPAAMHDQLNSITGVVDNGLFIDLCHTLVVATGDKVEVLPKG